MPIKQILRGREGERKIERVQVWDEVACLVNRSGFPSCRQNSRLWISSTTRLTGDEESQESPGQVILSHGHRAQVLQEGREQKRER
jgi:hypothetical protein